MYTQEIDIRRTWRGIKRQRERQSDVQIDRKRKYTKNGETDRKTDRKTEIKKQRTHREKVLWATNMDIKKLTERQIYRSRRNHLETDSEFKDRQTDRQIDKNTEREFDKGPNEQADRKTDR